MNSAMNSLIVFIHIPRTGGTSLIHALEPYFANHTRWSNGNPPFPEYRDGLDFVHGHINLNEIERLQKEHGLFRGRNIRYITLMRDPVQRTLSYYYCTNSHGRNMTFEEWLREKDDAARRTNAHVRQLASTDNPTEDDISIAIDRLLSMKVIFGFQNKEYPSGELDIDGVCGEVLKLTGIMPLSACHAIHNKNQSYPESFPPGYVTLAEKYNELDIEFLRRVKCLV